MEFQNEFDVDAPIDEVWKAMLDLERVAPAMPGAEVLEKVDDDNYKVAIKVKVGPVSMQYRGDVEFTDKDEAAHTAVMNVKAREARGQGQATAKVNMSLAEQGESKTKGEMKADVQLSGKAASMGRGIIQDVSARLVQQFANNLATMLAGPKAEPAAEPATTADSNGAGTTPSPLSTQETVEQPAISLDEPAVAAGAGASGGGGAGAAAAATTAAAEAPKTEAPKTEAPKTEAPKAEAPKAAPPKPQPAPAEAAEIDAMALGISMAKDRAKNNPIVIAAVVALLLAWLIGRRRG